MNKHKRKGLLLIILTFMFSCFAVTALATEITPEQVEKILEQQALSKAESITNPGKSDVSSELATSSKRTYSSKRSYKQQTSEMSSELESSEVSSGIVLPSVVSVTENDPLSSLIVNKNNEKKMNWIGIFSWVCIVLGVIVVLLVVFSNRRPPRGGLGRKRYRKPKRSKKKRLLNDKYYRNI